MGACGSIVNNVFGSWQWNYFISAPVFSTVVGMIPEELFVGKSFDQQTMVNAACSRVEDTDNQSYYPLSWQVLAQMTLNGEVAKAGGIATSPVSSPTMPPVSSPTMPPVTSNNFCCTWNFFDCGVDSWCNEDVTKCQGACGGVWIERSAPGMSCLAQYQDCTADENVCCNPLSCTGSEYYKQCL